MVTGAASAISQTTGTLNGTVNPNGSAITSCQFDWGTTSSYGSVTPCAQAVGSGTSPVPVSAALSGLSPNTTYYFNLVVTYVGATSAGTGQSFATVPQPTGSPPSVSPSPPEVKSSTESAFSGMVNPNGSSTTAHFEYGLDPRYTPGGPVVYDHTTPVQQVGSDDVEHSVTATATELVPNALYHVRLVATNGAGTVVGPDQTFMTAKDPMPPPPVLGKTFNAVPVSGLVFVKPPPGKSLGKAVDAAVHGLVKGHGFVPLTEARQLPSGSEIDARAGSLNLATAPPVRRGKLQTGVFGGGLFQTVQTRTGLEKGLTTLQLLFGIFKGAPTFGSCKTHAAGDTASQAGVSPTVLQTLHAHDKHGKWRTRGHNSSATVRGTVWDTVDRCYGTLTVVHRGTVNVFDFGRRKTIVVHAHHQYLAKAVRAKPRLRAGALEDRHPLT